MWGFRLRREAAPAARRVAPFRRPPPLRGGGKNFKFRLASDHEKNQNTQKKVPTTQPNPQYSAKNNVSIHMIETFMPKLPLHYFSKLPPHQQHFIILQYLIHFYKYDIVLLFANRKKYSSNIPQYIVLLFANFRKLVKITLVQRPNFDF